MINSSRLFAFWLLVLVPIKGTTLETAHNLGEQADIRFDFQAAINHGCPNFTIKHGSRPFLSVDFNLDGVPDPFVFYNCVRRGEELVHPYYYVGPDVNVLVMLSQPDGTFTNGNKATFGTEQVTAGYFGFVGFELRDHAYDLNGDGYKDFAYHVWRDGLWQADCYTLEAQQDSERCNDEDPDLLPAARWAAMHNTEGRYTSPPGGAYATRGLLLSNGDGTYELEILATGQDTEPGGGISIVQDSEGLWTIWIAGPYFGAGAYRDEIEQDWIPSVNHAEPLANGIILPAPGPKVYRFEDGDMLDVTSEYYARSTKGTPGLGAYCEYEKALAQKLAPKIGAAGFDIDDCRVWTDPRFGAQLQHGVEYLTLTDNPQVAVTWSQVTNRSFLTRVCFEQQGQVCQSPTDLDESFGERFTVPILRTWHLESGFGWVEQTESSPENLMAVIPTPHGIFWRIYDEAQWGYSLMDRPNGFLEKFKLTPDARFEHIVYTCCRNATYLDPGVEPESLGAVALENLASRFLQEPWSPDNCPNFLWGVENSHCTDRFAWRHMEPTDIFRGAPSNLYTRWLEAECSNAVDGSDAFEACLEEQGDGLLSYRYDAIKAGFDHISFAFDGQGRIQPKGFDPVAGLARNASNYPISIEDVNGDGLLDFVAGTMPWFNEWFSDAQRQGATHPRLTVGINNGAFGFEEDERYWPTLIGMNSNDASSIPLESLDNRLVAYYFGNWFEDFNRDGISDLLLFDRGQYGMANGALPEVAISYAVTAIDETRPAIPSIANSWFEDGILRVSLSAPQTSDEPNDEDRVTYVLVCTDGVELYQSTSQSTLLRLSGLNNEASFQCSVRAQNTNGYFSQASFTQELVASEDAMYESARTLPAWLIYIVSDEKQQSSSSEHVR